MNISLMDYVFNQIICLSLFLVVCGYSLRIHSIEGSVLFIYSKLIKSSQANILQQTTYMGHYMVLHR